MLALAARCLSIVGGLAQFPWFVVRGTGPRWPSWLALGSLGSPGSVRSADRLRRRGAAGVAVAR